MPLFTYNRNIPDAPNNPSDDQPLMKTNTNSGDDIWNTDHFGFNLTNGGWHAQSTYVESAMAPPTNVDQGAVYTKLASGETNLFYRRENNGSEIQLTNASTGAVGLINAATSFNAFGVANGILAPANIGYSFNIATITKTGTGQYTIAFTNNLPSANFVVTINCVDDSGSNDKDSHFTKVVTATRSTGGFSLETNRANNHSFDDPRQIMISCIGG